MKGKTELIMLHNKRYSHCDKQFQSMNKMISLHISCHSKQGACVLQPQQSSRGNSGGKSFVQKTIMNKYEL